MKQKKFSELKKLRRQFKITQQDMADELGKCLSSYAKKENGLIPFSLDEMVTIHKVINARSKQKGEDRKTFEDIFLPDNLR